MHAVATGTLSIARRAKTQKQTKTQLMGRDNLQAER